MNMSNSVKMYIICMTMDLCIIWMIFHLWFPYLVKAKSTLKRNLQERE